MNLLVATDRVTGRQRRRAPVQPGPERSFSFATSSFKFSECQKIYKSRQMGNNALANSARAGSSQGRIRISALCGVSGSNSLSDFGFGPANSSNRRRTENRTVLHPQEV